MGTQSQFFRMKRTSLAKYIGICAFVAVEIVLYAMFIAEDFGDAVVGENAYIKYATVCLAFLFAMIPFIIVAVEDGKGVTDGMLLALGLALTLVSDLLLLVKVEFFEVGLVTFIGAQLIYFARIKRAKLWLIVSIAVRITLSVVGIVVIVAVGEASAVFVLAEIYFVQLVTNFAENVVSIFTAKGRSEKCRAIVLSIGFLLFIGCDVCVGLSNLYNGMANELIWLFYTPSQVLIALSNRRIYEKGEMD